MNDCVSLHEGGGGLIVDGCVYDSFNYPNKYADLANIESGSGCTTFLSLGLTSGGIAANCVYDLPIVVSNNVCKGLSSSFFIVNQNTLTAKNLQIRNNHIEGLPGAAGTFTTYSAAVASTDLTDSVFESNSVALVNGSHVEWSTNLVIAYKDSLLAAPFPVLFKVDGVYYARIPVDNVVLIPKVAKAGQRLAVLMHADAAGFGFFRIVPENAAVTTIGATLAANIKGTATGSSLTGTTGTSGDITFGLMNTGDLYIENRSAAAYTFRLSIQ
jgi:hypothetical protein